MKKLIIIILLDNMTTLDLEQSAPLRRRGPRPEAGNDAMSMIPDPPPGLPARHPLNLMKRTAIIGGTLYVMHGKFFWSAARSGALFVLLFVAVQSLDSYHSSHINSSSFFVLHRNIIPKHATQISTYFTISYTAPK